MRISDWSSDVCSSDLIRDKVAILGMGCARFGERWNDDAEQLMVEAYVEAMADAGIEPSQIDAAWQSVGFDAMNVGPSGIPAAIALRSEEHTSELQSLMRISYAVFCLKQKINKS